MDRKTKTLRERVLEHCAVLRIPITPEELDQVIAVAEQEGLSFLEATDRLLGEQAARRRDRGIKRRITAAHFPEHKTLETFDWKFNKTINRAQYEQLATGDFIRRRANGLMYSMRPSASPQAKFAGSSATSIVPRCLPSGRITHTPPGPEA
jgi:DNA replication protein DnaC